MHSSGAASAATTVPLSEDDRRMMQLKSVFNKLFKRKKDKKGKDTGPELDPEELQVWKNLAPLVLQPSAVFMGLSFMIEDKGSALQDTSNVDWNMNVILALVKVNHPSIHRWGTLRETFFFFFRSFHSKLKFLNFVHPPLGCHFAIYIHLQGHQSQGQYKDRENHNAIDFCQGEGRQGTKGTKAVFGNLGPVWRLPTQLADRA